MSMELLQNLSVQKNPRTPKELNENVQSEINSIAQVELYFLRCQSGIQNTTSKWSCNVGKFFKFILYATLKHFFLWLAMND